MHTPEPYQGHGVSSRCLRLAPHTRMRRLDVLLTNGSQVARNRFVHISGAIDHCFDRTLATAESIKHIRYETCCDMRIDRLF
jgi:hypothetical protein